VIRSLTRPKSRFQSTRLPSCSKWHHCWLTSYKLWMLSYASIRSKHVSISAMSRGSTPQFKIESRWFTKSSNNLKDMKSIAKSSWSRSPNQTQASSHCSAFSALTLAPITTSNSSSKSTHSSDTSHSNWARSRAELTSALQCWSTSLTYRSKSKSPSLFSRSWLRT